LDRLRHEDNRLPEKMVMVGLLPETIVIDPGDQVSWLSNSGNLKIEFDAQRCPFSSNVFQAPPGVRLSSGAARAGINPGSYRYRLSLNDVVVGHGEVLIRGK
jgi:plastocyanin